MSEFIEKSKHQGMTSLVHDHIMGKGKGHNASDPTPHPSSPIPFPSDRGDNYTPPGAAGHHTK